MFASILFFAFLTPSSPSSRSATSCCSRRSGRNLFGSVVRIKTLRKGALGAKSELEPGSGAAQPVHLPN